MDEVYTRRRMNSTSTGVYATSSLASYLNTTFYNYIESTVRSYIKTVKIPYVDGSTTANTVKSGSNGFSAKVFLLSNYEIGGINASRVDGALLSYFRTPLTSLESKSRLMTRVQTSGSGTSSTLYIDSWMTRTMRYGGYITKVGCVPTLDNQYSSASDFNPWSTGSGVSRTEGVRPAFILNSSTPIYNGRIIAP